MGTKKAKIQIVRGNKNSLPTLLQGELGYATDSNELFIGDPDDGNVLINTNPYDDTNIKNNITDIEEALVEVSNNIGTVSSQLETNTNKIGNIEPLELFKNPSKGTITIICDDLYKSWYNNVYLPLLKVQNIKFGLTYCPVDRDAQVGPSYPYVEDAQFREILNTAKTESLFHGWTHLTYDSSMSEDNFIKNIKDTLNWFKENDIEVYGWVAPNTQFDTNKEKIISKYFNYGYSNCQPTTVNGKNSKQQMNRISTDSLTSINDTVLKSALEKAKNGEWLTIYGHRYGEEGYPPASLISDIIAYANSNNIDILLPTEAFIKHNKSQVSLKYPKKSNNYVYKSTQLNGQNITGTDYTSVLWSSIPKINTLGDFNGGSSLTFKKEDLYFMCMNLLVKVTTTNFTTLGVGIFINGVAVEERNFFTKFSDTFYNIQFNTVLDIKKNDIVEIKIKKNSAEDLAISSNSSSISFVKLIKQNV